MSENALWKEVEKCFESAQKLKEASQIQQKILKKILNMSKVPNKQCPMCETFFEVDQEEFENHVIDHFQVDISLCE